MREVAAQLQQHRSIPMSPYNESLGVYLARIASVTYCQLAHIQKWTCSPCQLVEKLLRVETFHDPKDNFQGLVGFSKSHHAIVVAYRGSMDVVNWLDNLTIYQTRAYKDFPTVRVHEGFYWAYRSVADQVVQHVHTLRRQYPHASVYLTGHSLGGAVATICAFEFQMLNDLPVTAVYTFGEPRVGNVGFSEIMNTRIPHISRLTHFRDVVPHLPPTWIGFYHTAREVYYDEYFTDYKLCDDTDGEDYNCSDACSPFGCTSIVDHVTYLNVTMSHLIC